MFYSIVVHFSQLEQTGGGTSPMSAYFGQQSLLMALSLLLLCPALCMRTLAEERRSGSIEALLSAPIGAASIVSGKYLAVFLTYCAIWLPTLAYPLTLRDSGTVSWPVLACCYVGVLLVGASYLALGVMMSSLVRSQLAAHLLTTAVIFGLFVLGIGEYIFEEGALRELCAYVSLTSMLEETAQGVIDSRRLVFHFSTAVWALFVSSRVVESWRAA